MAPVIAIRAYRPSDLEALIALYRGAVRRIARADYSEAQVLAWSPDNLDAVSFGERRAAKPTWLAEIGGVVVGFSDLEPDGHIDSLYVHPDYQRMGVASRLLAQVEAAAREQSLTRLYSEISITAKPLFQRNGFAVIAPQAVVFGGQEFINYKMEKILGLK